MNGKKASRKRRIKRREIMRVELKREVERP